MGKANITLRYFNYPSSKVADDKLTHIKQFTCLSDAVIKVPYVGNISVCKWFVSVATILDYCRVQRAFRFRQFQSMRVFLSFFFLP